MIKGVSNSKPSTGIHVIKQRYTSYLMIVLNLRRVLTAPYSLPCGQAYPLLHLGVGTMFG